MCYFIASRGDISLCVCCTLHYSETFFDRCNRYFEITIYGRGSDLIVCRLIDRRLLNIDNEGEGGGLLNLVIRKKEKNAMRFG